MLINLCLPLFCMLGFVLHPIIILIILSGFVFLHFSNIPLFTPDSIIILIIIPLFTPDSIIMVFMICSSFESTFILHCPRQRAWGRSCGGARAEHEENIKIS